MRGITITFVRNLKKKKKKSQDPFHPRPEETPGVEISNLHFEQVLQEILMKAEFEFISFLLASGFLCKKCNCVIPPVHRPPGYLEDKASIFSKVYVVVSSSDPTNIFSFPLGTQKRCTFLLL